MSDNNKNLAFSDYICNTITSNVSDIISTPSPIDNGYLSLDITTNTLSVDGVAITMGDVSYTDPYAELEGLIQEKEEDEKLRSKHAVLQEAYEHYQLIKKLVEDNEIDKTFEYRYRGFKNK